MVWAVGNARVEPKVTKQVSGSEDRSANGGVQCDCFDGDEAAFIAADCFLDLDAARALRDAAHHLPQRMMPTAAALDV
jgi:hypothetical protein